MNWVDVSLPCLIGFFMIVGPELYVISKPGDVPEEIERRQAVYGRIGFLILLIGAIFLHRSVGTVKQGRRRESSVEDSQHANPGAGWRDFAGRHATVYEAGPPNEGR